MKTEFKHTPGPWTSGLKVLEKGIKKRIQYTIPGYRFIRAGVGYYDVEDPEESVGFEITGYLSEDDARLMHAAPELLQALKDLLEACELADAKEELGEDVDGSLMDQANAAIRKALGLKLDS